MRTGNESVRRFHLGLDWGTSTTKLVLRDYSQGSGSAAFVLTPDGSEGEYRYPSAVDIKGEHLYFGATANRRGIAAGKRLDSLKALSTLSKFSEKAPGAKKLTYEDLAILFLSHAISLGMRTAIELASRVDSHARLGMTLGIPTEVGWSSSSQGDTYLRLARTAFDIAVRAGIDPQGMHESDAFTLVTVAKEVACSERSGSSDRSDECAQWLRPELGAAMLWGFKSPAIEPGLYSCVDIGAWTVNASYFRIHHDRIDGEYVEKGALSFFGGACQQPGMNAVCEILAEAILEKDPVALRGREEVILGRHPVSVIEPATRRFLSTWKTGFSRAYQKDPMQSHWDNLKIMVIGGGSKVSPIRDIFRTAPQSGWTQPVMVPNLGMPADLYHIPSRGITPRKRFEGDNTFLLVAYGLSVRHEDFPPFKLSDEVAPMTRPRTYQERPTSEELGYEEK